MVRATPNQDCCLDLECPSQSLPLIKECPSTKLTRQFRGVHWLFPGPPNVEIHLEPRMLQSVSGQGFKLSSTEAQPSKHGIYPTRKMTVSAFQRAAKVCDPFRTIMQQGMKCPSQGLPQAKSAQAQNAQGSLEGSIGYPEDRHTLKSTRNQGCFGQCQVRISNCRRHRLDPSTGSISRERSIVK